MLFILFIFFVNLGRLSPPQLIDYLTDCSIIVWGSDSSTMYNFPPEFQMQSIMQCIFSMYLFICSQTNNIHKLNGSTPLSLFRCSLVRASSSLHICLSSLSVWSIQPKFLRNKPGFFPPESSPEMNESFHRKCMILV